MKTQTDPKVDYAFKHVFGREQSKPALKSLLDAVLPPPEGHGIASLEALRRAIRVLQKSLGHDVTPPEELHPLSLEELEHIWAGLSNNCD